MRTVERKTLLTKKVKTHETSHSDIAFITGYSNQYPQLEYIIKKYWPILKEDRTLAKNLPHKPRFIYRRAPTLRNHLVHNVIDPPTSVQICPELKGFYRCQRCLPCRKSKPQPRKRTTFKSNLYNKEYQIKELITCNCAHVTYVVECPCRLQYMGRTTRPLRVWIREHITNIQKGFPKHSLPRHFDEVYHRDPSGLVFYGVDIIKDHWRRSNKKILVSQNETRWIHRLGSSAPGGLNLDIDLNCFISIFNH